LLKPFSNNLIQTRQFGAEKFVYQLRH